MLDLTTTLTETMTTSTVLLCSLVSIVLGGIIALTFNFRNRKSKGFLITLAILPFIVQIVIMLVNGNLGTGVAVMGAFSLVRFRSVPGNAKDICSIFLSMAIGLATGTNHLLIAAIVTVTVCVLSIVYTLIPYGEKGSSEKELTVVIPESLDYNEIFDDIFEKYTTKCELVQVKTTNMGSLYKLKYHVVIKNPADEKTMIDDIRVRNGNLEIMCGKVPSNETEQL